MTVFSVQLELVWHVLELMWQKLKLGPWVLCMYVHQSIFYFLFGGMRVLDFLNLKPSIFCFSKQPGSSEEWAMFHVMFRILEATKGLCLPLPPGKRTPDCDNLRTLRKEFQILVSSLFVSLLHAY